MSAAGRFFITPHAVQRYRERAARSISYETALAELIQQSECAHRVKPMRDGAELWRGPKPLRLRMIVMPQKAGLPQLLTVKRGHDGANMVGKEQKCEASR